MGHFPPVVQALAQLSLVCAERNPQPEIIEAACEYLLPEQDYVFITGETLIYKTLPRLLVLAKKSQSGLVGPVRLYPEVLFKFGVNVICSLWFRIRSCGILSSGGGLLAPIFAAGESHLLTKLMQLKCFYVICVDFILCLWYS